MVRRLADSLLLASLCLLLLTAAASAQTRALFSSQQSGDSGLQQYSIDLSTGALTQQGSPVASGTVPTVPGISPNGANIYVAAYLDSEVHGFSIGSGGLTPISGLPVSTSFGPNEAIVSPGGSSLFTADSYSGNVSAFSVGSSGGLAGIVGSPFPSGGNPNAVAVSPNNPYLYSSGYGGDVLSGFRVGGGGELTPLTGSPWSHPGTPSDVEYNVAGNSLFVANNANDDISSYAIDPATGALTEVAGSPFSVGDGPAALSSSADGKWLFVVNANEPSVQSFAIGANGALTPAGAAVATGPNPYDVNLTPDSRFAYVANYDDATISGYSVGSDGGLTPLNGSPFGGAPSTTLASFAIVPDQGPTASFSSGVKDNTVSFNAAGSSDPDGSVATYLWDFGDNTSATTTSPQATHTYADAGSFTVTLRVVDNENCSNVQVGTGQTLACNGGSRAVTSASANPIGPLTLKHSTGKQLTSKKVNGTAQRRVQIEFFLNRNAGVTYQFQKSTSKGRCRKATSKKPGGKTTYKNFGKKVVFPGTTGRDRRTFTGKFGGKTIVPGRYRVKLQASSPDSDATPVINSASFCVS